MTQCQLEELQRRLTEADAEIEALRNGQVDAIVGDRGVSLLRDRAYEEKYRQAAGDLATANAELDAARRAALNLMNDAIAAREEAECTAMALRASQARLRDLNRDLERRVEQRTAELRLLASRVASAQEAERQRIAAGLHDSVCQLLAACQLKLAQVENCTDAAVRSELLQAADAMLVSANEEARCLTFELSSATLFDGGLLDSVRDLCSYMTKQYQITFDLTSSDPEISIPPHPRAALYHCIRELMHNVVKHAGVDHAMVRIEQRGGEHGPRVLVSIRDYGKGFDPEHLDRPLTWQGGFGLRQVRERMRDIGGTLRIESVPGDGTKAVLEVELNRTECGEECS